MKKGFVVVLIGLCLSNWLIAQDTRCARKAYFGEAEICLPPITGYRECYTDPVVKQLADNTEVASNMVIGFYLSQETYDKRDSIGLMSFDNYFKIYGTRQIMDYHADMAFLYQMQMLLSENFILKNWDEMKKGVDEIGLEVEIGAPTVIKNYQLNDRSFTYMMLVTYEMPGVKPYTMAMTINGVLMSERLVWMAYYLRYKGEETITRLEERSNQILTALSVGR